MRTLKLLTLATVLVAAANSLLAPAHAQTQSPADIKAAAELVQALSDQQKVLSDNQAKIDAKLASIAENIRVARIYASRVK